ncbi:MAG: GDP-mannose 4,6-dehydratase [SAR324 cluster bacterium]|nr:GDP-mannose 4,6-dehydratase [SAR324 cluster bacterium]
MKKTALITGITGQDGAYLAQHLLGLGYEVYGAYRRSAGINTSNLDYLGVTDGIKMVSFELLELTNIIRTIEKIQPDEVYNLAAQSFVGASFDQPLFTAETNDLGVLRLLEAIRLVNKDIKFYQASTSEMFGKVQSIPQTEKTPFYPRSPYAVAKLAAHWYTTNYRESYDMFACSGILFNHESPIRGHEFVTRKITMAVARIQAGTQSILTLGNLQAKRDWGYAKEYVQLMHKMLQHETADDYVIATNETNTIERCVEVAFAAGGIEIEWQGEGVDQKGIDKKTGKALVEVSPEFFRPAEVELLIGSPQKAKDILGWEPKTTFKELIELMVAEDIKRL